MTGYISITLNSILYAVNFENMHFGIGLKPAAVWNSQELDDLKSTFNQEGLTLALSRRFDNMPKIFYTTVDSNLQFYENGRSVGEPVIG